MSDEDAFLAALAAHPGDDTTRLVYADWLDENGEPAKAEYLRLVAELVPYYQTGGADPPQTARVLALAETLPQDWRLAAAARFTAVLLSCELPQKIAAVKLVRELTGQGLAEAKSFVEAAPRPLVTRTTLEAAVGFRDRFRQAGVTIQVDTAGLPNPPGLVTYDIIAEVYSLPLDGSEPIPAEVLDRFRKFLMASLRITAEEADALTGEEPWAVLDRGLEAGELKTRLERYESLLPQPPASADWVIVLSSSCRFSRPSPPT